MKVYDFDVPIKNLKGETLKDGLQDVIAGPYLAGILAMMTRGNVVKIYGWARELYDHKKVSIDEADLDVLKKTIENFENVAIFAKAQLLECLSKPLKNEATQSINGL